MSIELLHFEKSLYPYVLGCLSVKYYQLVLKCDLMYHPKAHKAWIRLPRRFFKNGKSYNYCHFPEKDISDDFQIIVLKQIFDKYDLDLEKVAEMHKDARIRKEEYFKNIE